MCPHRPATWAGICSRAGPPVSECVSLVTSVIRVLRLIKKKNQTPFEVEQREGVRFSVRADDPPSPLPGTAAEDCC
jgi:hypothetical protein